MVYTDADDLESGRDELHDQHALTEEIGAAMSRNPLGEQIDETELDKELEELEQENTNAQLLGAGTDAGRWRSGVAAGGVDRVRVCLSSSIPILPLNTYLLLLTCLCVLSEEQSGAAGGGRGGRGAEEAAGGDGDVMQQEYGRSCPRSSGPQS